jgi:hypothetical protein
VVLVISWGGCLCGLFKTVVRFTTIVHTPEAPAIMHIAQKAANQLTQVLLVPSLHLMYKEDIDPLDQLDIFIINSSLLQSRVIVGPRLASAGGGTFPLTNLQKQRKPYMLCSMQE